MKTLSGRCVAFLCCLFLLAPCCGAGNFLSKQHASEILVRKRRANSLIEERKQGNLERECIEELCNKEEAREVFENDPETNYFYPKYLACLGTFQPGRFVPARRSTYAFTDLRSCVTAIPDQCFPLPCHEDGYLFCKDGQGRYTCVCRPGWHGERCENDIDECEDPMNTNGGCSQNCINYPGSFHCSCKTGYQMLLNKKDCRDVNECLSQPSVCGKAECRNTEGSFECVCAEGFNYNPRTKECEDVDECAENMCAQLCVNFPGGYSCYCDGKKGFMLALDQKNCEPVPMCLPLNLDKNYELLYLAEQSVGIPSLYLRFRLPDITRFSAEFDFRTYDSEGVILYAESLDSTAWFLLALRNGRLEIQFKNEHAQQVTSGGKIINDGLWNMVSVEELEGIISVKIAKEAVMNINRSGSLFKSTSGFLETKVHFAGLPRKMENNLIKSINPRLDGCIRGWNLMNQGTSGVKEIIQEKQKRHCLVTMEKGSYYPATGVAQFDLDYGHRVSSQEWQLNLTLTIRPSTSTGVMFALVSGERVPLALSLVDSNSSHSQDIVLNIENVTVSRIKSIQLCTPQKSQVDLRVNAHLFELKSSFPTQTIYSEKLQEQLGVLNKAMQGPISTYLGGIPDVPVTATPVSAFYNGCMEVKVNGRELDLDEAIFKQNDIRSHSCPTVLEEN
ncbi:vitamin K-dependent protein S [Ornithorhynchus anatinus]|uniref:Vitamin K-dependent protein S n=1 Tax=Ornithorhynchus anatinus TaxID=9258 RepID=F7EX33_ORNAN|nr:vitamin K-dependent protein S [Ornithorhynchus anatinus]